MNTYASAIHAAIKNAIRLRYYQDDLVRDIQAAWGAGAQAVLAVMATGAGKTVTFGSVVSEHRGAAACIAHRQELVGQISLALARFGIRHNIIAPPKVVKNIVSLHVRKVGTSFVMPSSPIAVAGVDTLIRKGKTVPKEWLKTVTLQVHDEGHHLLRGNKWGRAVELFTHRDCKLLSVSAGPERADGKGLGRHAEGYVDVMIVGPNGKQLIDLGYLTPYKVVMAQSDVQLTKDMFSTATGELNEKGKAHLRGSHIVGDVVEAYKKYTPDEPAIVFASDVETSIKIAQQFRDAGIPALHVDGDTDDDVREDAVRKLEDGRLKVLTNVGLFGEGFDLPCVVAVYDCSATESFGNYLQRFGRMLRLAITAEQQAMWEDLTPAQRKAAIAASPKPYGYYVDLVGNMVRHRGPPVGRNDWTLDSRERRGGGATDGQPSTFCLNPDAGGGIACGQTYERFRSKCPFCGFRPEPSSRASPEVVDGDLTLLDEAALQALYGGAIDVDAAFYPTRQAGSGVALKLVKGHAELVAVQRDYRDAFAWWAGELRAAGMEDGELFKLFYLKFGVDAVTLCGERDKEKLRAIINELDAVLTEPSKRARVHHTV